MAVIPPELTSNHTEFGADKYTFMMVIASLSWLLLTCLSKKETGG